MVISGGEGYEEYKQGVTVNVSGSSIGSNSAVSNQQAISLLENQTSNMLLNTSAASPPNTSSLLSSSSIDETSTGKEDLTNIVLTWEI